jgi:hypothetical protein
MKQISSLIILVISLTGCDYITSLNKTGDKESININAQSPVELVVNASCKIQLFDSKSDTMTMSGYDFVVEDYQYKHEGQQLIVSHKNGEYLQREKMGTLAIPINQINRITVNAPSIIASDDTLNVQTFTVVINGRGLYSETNLLIDGQNFNLNVYGGNNQTMHRLAGTTTNCALFIEGCAPVDAENLQCQNVTITQRSIADCAIRVDQKLTANIYSSGNIYYTGNPLITCTKHTTTLMSATGEVLSGK